MPNRKERREAECLARKSAYLQLRAHRAEQSNTTESSNSPTPTAEEASPHSPSEPSPASPPPAAPISAAQLTANRANAQLSRGPLTDAGKAISSKNSLKHGLTSKTVLLPGEDAVEYQRQLDAYIEIFHPANHEELRLVQSQLDCIWRLNRIARIETSILVKGHLELADKFEDRDPKDRAHLIGAEAFLKYERQIRNLNIQEAHLRRTLEKDRAELHRIQMLRKHQERIALESETTHATPAAPRANGFDFSTHPTPNSIPAKSAHQTRTRAA